jgi:hypothetical protein
MNRVRFPVGAAFAFLGLCGVLPDLHGQVTAKLDKVVAFHDYTSCNLPETNFKVDQKNVSTGIVTATFSARCSDNPAFDISGTLTFSFPAGPLTGTDENLAAIGGSKVLRLVSPVNIGVTADLSAPPRFSVRADAAAYPGINGCSVPSPDSAKWLLLPYTCSAPYLAYAYPDYVAPFINVRVNIGEQAPDGATGPNFISLTFNASYSVSVTGDDAHVFFDPFTIADAPPKSESVFVASGADYVDSWPKCSYGPDGPIVFYIPIGRYIGDTTSEQYLSSPSLLIRNNVIGPTAKLQLMTWDIDSSPPNNAVPPERDVVTVNGFSIGSSDVNQPPTDAVLTGINNHWSINSFDVPISKLLFPKRGANGQPPFTVLNRIQVDVDTLNKGKKVWCASVLWATITIDAMAPLILVHGTNGQHDTWDLPIAGPQPNGPVRTVPQHLADLGVPFEYKIDLEPNGNPWRNAEKLAQAIHRYSAETGARKLHLVAHSKGATDSRFLLSPSHQFTGLYNPDSTDVYGVFEVLSLYSLGCPSQGTILSDLVLASRDVNVHNPPLFGDDEAKKSALYKALEAVGDVDLVNRGFLFYLENRAFATNLFGGNVPIPTENTTQLAAPAGSALSLQTLSGMRRFNAETSQRPGVKYYSIAGDADLNRDKFISAAESEAFLPPSIPALSESVARELNTETYKMLGQISSVGWKTVDGTRYVIGDVLRDDQNLVPNDMVSTMPSVHCLECGFTPLESYPLAGSSFPANHSALKSVPVIDRVLKQINADFPVCGQAAPCKN